MGIKIEITDSKFSDDAIVINGWNVSDASDVNVRMSHVEVKDNVEILNNLTDKQIDEVLERLEVQTELLEKTSGEYAEIKNLLAEVQRKKSPAREILKQHLPSILTGALANILSGMLMK